ncbi:electron transport complex subunit C [Thalassotalea insulae]|uniref:Ion-translocating oxidoreductase complex subunit C n=1 Tax=Thalassotalea insulae TaxID=2056778 RepID=A0ABQ6GMI8_9GAMM|nr:electron transport complex subunit RsxC [Thalassotalea insulae]GLX77208.1 electron transport complex subunit C [Thalassotalea insulae]
MESVIERIEKGHFWKFHGGIHPPEMKFLTSDKPIRPLAMPPELIIPVQQHIGEAGQLIVSVGEQVKKGQPLTKSSMPLSVPVHAPTSGTISAIENSVIAHPSGLEELCIKLLPDGEDSWCQRQLTPDYQTLTKHQIIEKIAQAGISGMGGAGFPTHIKVNTQAQINYLIINAAECEPYISADDLLIREHNSTIVDGINILDHLLEPAFILIGIEDNKPEAIQALKKATAANDKIKICVLPTKYPTGGEKQLIMALTGQEVPSGVLPSSLGIVMQNIATCYAIADAVIHDTPLIKRVVTLSGRALAKPQNVWALLGTPVEFLLQQCGYPELAKKHIIMGGPMMGFSLPSTQVPVVKTTNCVLAPSEQEIPDNNKEVECIRCGQCAEVCPSQLLPQELQWSAKAKDQQELEALNLFDCIECGACAYVCPSHIPLVHYYRVAKAEIRQQKLLDLKAEKAKQRFEARKVRLERDKLAREEKHRKAAEARKAKMNAGTEDANNEKSAVAAALARVKAKKAQAQSGQASASQNNEQSNEQVNDKKSQVAAAVARAKAKKLAAANAKSVTNQAADDHLNNDTAVDTTPANITAQDDKKAKIAAAVAKAKAKKASSAPEVQEDQQEPDIKPEVNEKKDRIAAAVAKAKAKKQAAKQASTNANSDTSDNPPSDDDNSQRAEPMTQVAPSEQPMDKKARIAAAVAKAKAKKQQAESK